MTAVAAGLFIAVGLALLGIGGYFALARPAFLPEDRRFIGSPVLLEAAPGLSRWLRNVFQVMGGYIASTGVLVVYTALAARSSSNGMALAVLTVAGGGSVGLMALVNFRIRSDFRWPPPALAGLWGLAVALALVVR